MSILSALKTQSNSIDDLAALPQAMIMQMAQKGQIREDMLAPILSRKAEMADAVARTKALQGQGAQQPTVMEQIMAKNAEAEAPDAREMGVAQLPVRQDMFNETSMAGGGIVAFADGGDIDDDEEESDYYQNLAEESMLEDILRGSAEGFGIKAEAKGGSENPFMPRGNTKEYAEKTAEKYGLDPAYVNKIIAKETGGLKNPERAVSPAGAQGIMQLMPGTAKDLGVKDVFDPFQNIEGGVKYLAQLNKKYDDPRIAAIAYNWGPGNTDKWLKAGADPKKLPAETRRYVASLAEGGEVKGYAKGGFSVADTLSPGEEIIEVPEVKKPYSFEDYMANFAKERENLKASAEEDKNLALMAAGLGMLGGTSPYAFANIGQGGQRGIEQYAAAKKQRGAELAAINKAELGGLRARELEDYRKARLQAEADKRESGADLKESQLIQKIDASIGKMPIVADFKKRMEFLEPNDPKYKYYASEIEKVYDNAYKNAGIKRPRITYTPADLPEEPKSEGWWSNLFGGSKPSSGGTIKYNAKGEKI